MFVITLPVKLAGWLVKTAVESVIRVVIYAVVMVGILAGIGWWQS